MSQPRLFVGTMSGTSADGVDAALVRIEGVGLDMVPALLRHHHRPYDPSLQRTIFDIRSRGDAKLSELAKLGREISLTYAATVNELLLAAGESAVAITAIAAHGQTLFHDPPNTIQWFDPALVAAETGCAVVSDFRRADCAAGGQGAPLVPFADYILFRHPTKTRAVLNIGGIANVTILPAGASLESVKAFDTGPGNCISDHVMRRMDPDGKGFDFNGELALHGKPDLPIIGRMLASGYFHQPPPKSTDGPAMIELYQRYGNAGARLHDQVATACLLTASAIRKSLENVSPAPAELIVSGGGSKNRAIMKHLTTIGPIIRTTDELGVKSDAKEALAFALLACATLDSVPSNVPSVTGAKRSVVLGAVTPRP